MSLASYIGRVEMAPFSNALPSIGVTELPALDAGTVDFEGELFNGNPNFDALRARGTNHVTTAEQNFVDTRRVRLQRNAG